MRGTLSTAEVHDRNRPELVAMVVKEPEVREVCNKSLIKVKQGNSE